jgi:hypothetical protein
LLRQATIVAALEILEHTEKRILIKMSGVREVPKRWEHGGIAIEFGV